MRICIIGGGISGLTAALSLHAAGIEAHVFEAVSDIQPLGLGINLQPNAVRELTELGLKDALARTAIETSTLRYYNKHGQLIWSEPRGLAAGYKWPQYAIHRGQLQMILLDAVRERLGPDAIKLGHQLTSFTETEGWVIARFVDKRTGRELPSFAADALIGADGIRSAVRTVLHPSEGPAVFGGRIYWRGCVECESFLDGRTQVMIGHGKQRAVVYPMSSKVAPGRSLLNWLTVLADQPNDRTSESWDREVKKERFFAPFSGWNFDWIKAADIMSSTGQIFEYPAVDRDPLPRWSFGRATLIGDAAHPMRPVGSQAGSQGIVDARVVALALATESSPVKALQSYEANRLPIVNELIMRNRRDGPEVVMQMAEDRAPEGFENIEDVIPRSELERIASSFKVAAGFDPEALNARSSLQGPNSLKLSEHENQQH